MKKNSSENCFKKLKKKADLKMSLLNNFNFVMIHIIHKILVLIQNHVNYLKDNIFEFFCKKYNRLLFSKKDNFLNNI